jgi:hypothetical protein
MKSIIFSGLILPYLVKTLMSLFFWLLIEGGENLFEFRYVSFYAR